MRPRLALLFALLVPICAVPACAREFRSRVVHVIDGDTIEIGRELFGKRQRIRLLGIDTPEIGKAMCPAEREAGVAAREALARLLPSGTMVRLSQVKPDKYAGRWDARVKVLGQPGLGDIAAQMLRSGHGRHYNGGRRDPLAWCREK